MKANILKSQLSSALAAARAATGGKKDLDILQNVLLDATDGHVSVTGCNLSRMASWRVDAETVQPGAALLNAEALSAMVASLPDGEITLDAPESARMAKITGGGVTFSLVLGDVAAFPAAPTLADTAASFSLAAATFGEILRKVSPSISTDTTRRVLTGIHLAYDQKAATLTAESTDGARASQVFISLDAAASIDAIIPAATVVLLRKLLSCCAPDGIVTASLDANRLRVTSASWTITSSLVADVYPSVSRVFPDERPAVCTIDREEFLSNLHRAAIVTRSLGDVPSVDVVFESGSVTCKATSASASLKQSMAAKYDGEKVTLRIDSDKLGPLLDVIDEDTVELGVVGAGKPLVISCSAPYRAIVMPLRVS